MSATQSFIRTRIKFFLSQTDHKTLVGYVTKNDSGVYRGCRESSPVKKKVVIPDSELAKGMVEKNAYCTDILIQVSAVNSALNSFNKELLANHIKTCVARDIRLGKEDTIDELVLTLQKLMK